jgi:hypothetical protein
MKRATKRQLARLTAAVRTAAAYKKFYSGAALVVLAACSTVPTPTSELAAARTAVAQAASQPTEDAGAVLVGARDKLARAEQALQRGDNLQARLYAEQAEADARLALATAENVRAQRAARVQ